MSESPVEPPLARGVVEYLENRDGWLHVRGWMLDAGGDFETVGIEVRDGATFPAERIERPDVATTLQWIPKAAGAGFAADLGRIEGWGATPTECRAIGFRGGRPVGQVRFGYWRRERSSPVPPEHLMYRVAHTRYPYIYRAGGRKAAYDLWSVLRRHGVDLRRGRALDWGCGSGRVLAFLSDLLPGTELYGADIDREAIAWIAAQLPAIQFSPCGADPPLPFSEESFDLVVAVSVFTHLTREAQLAWLSEIRRVLAPGGFLLATTHGPFASRYGYERPPSGMTSDGFDDSIRDRTLEGVAPADYYRATYQTQAYTSREWGRILEVRECLEGGSLNFQDLWVLRRK